MTVAASEEWNAKEDSIQHSLSCSISYVLEKIIQSKLEVSCLTQFDNTHPTHHCPLSTLEIIMAVLQAPPSLLVFGPQTEFPSEEILSDLRQELISNPHLTALKDSVAELPHFWKTLVTFDPSLRVVPGSEHLAHLVQWVTDGGSFPHYNQGADTLNHYALAVTVLLQISQYLRYLGNLGEVSHHRILSSVSEGGGIQGFCVGFLSAIAIAGTVDEAGLGATAAIALRLAVCVGAYVDRDGVFAKEPSLMRCVAVRWRGEGMKEVQDVIRSFPQVRYTMSKIW